MCHAAELHSVKDIEENKRWRGKLKLLFTEGLPHAIFKHLVSINLLNPHNDSIRRALLFSLQTGAEVMQHVPGQTTGM